MRMSGSAIRVFVVALVAFSVGCSTSVFKHTKGTTYGDIMVGDARVSSRERLVNDRLTQDSWLKDELKRADQQDFGFQGASDLRSFVGTSTRLEVTANPLEIDRYRAQAAQSADAARRSEEQANLDNQLLRQYKQRQLEAMNEQPASAFTYNPPTAKPETPTAPSLPAVPKAVEDLRQLDTSKSTIDPSNLRLADKLKPSPNDVLRDKLEYRNLIRTEILENALDDRHDLKGNTLLRFDLDAAVRPDDDTSAWAVITVEIDTKNWLQDCVKEELYEKWVKYVQTELRERTLLLLRNSFEAARANEGEAAPNKKDEAYIKGIVAFLPDYLLLGIQRDWLEKNNQYRPATSIMVDKAMVGLEAAKRANKALQFSDKNERKKIYHEIIYKEIIEVHESLIEHQFADYINVQKTDKNELMIKLSLKQDPSGDKYDTTKFCKKLLEKYDLFAYAPTPKESVQRISDVASRRNASELMLALSFLGGNSVAGNLYSNYMKISEGIFQAMRRQPLVVGFSNGTTSYATGRGEAEERRTSFGWILGPRFSIRNDGSESHFRHTVAFNSLSSVVSLPGWLENVEFKIKTQWVNDDGARYPSKPEEKTISVRLKPDMSTITDVLAKEPFREPRPHTRQLLKWNEGAPATIVIPGQNLWRNPVVLLGSQQADEVTVLPDMRGIVAKFKEVKLQRPRGSSERDIVVVWTSEGHADAALVEIIPSKKPVVEPKASLPSAPAINGKPLH